MKKTIQVLKPMFRVDETVEEIRSCLEKGWTGIGFKTDEFEAAWKKYSGFKNAHFLNSATSGLHLAINIFKKRYGWLDSDEVITSSLTFVSTNHAILYEKLTPVFADVDNSLCLNPESVQALITPKTRAVMFVGIGGNAENYQAIKRICEKNNLVFILDAAHMAGSKWADTGLQIGLDADCAVFSFQAVKNCPSSDSGIICFKDGDLDSQSRKLSWLGIDKSTYDRYSESSYKWRYDVNDLGFKYNGNSIAAAMCLVSLKYLDEDNLYRNTLTKYYDLYLKDKAISIVSHSEKIISSRHLYQITTTERDEIVEKLANNGIYCGVHYMANHNYNIYKNFKSDVKNANKFSNELISLPLHLHLDESDIKYISSFI